MTLSFEKQQRWGVYSYSPKGKYSMKAKEGSMGMFCRVGVDIGNLNNSTFLGASCISDDPRETRERYTKKDEWNSAAES